MTAGEFLGVEFSIIMDYRAPADTTTTTIASALTDGSFDIVSFEIVDVSGKGSRREVAVSVDGREIP